MYDLIVIGGGAAGVFAAISSREKHIALLEKSAVLMAKVKVSGGGRCNVTHACFDPKELALNYPRGGKELLGPFSRFQPRDTVAWFESHGVPLKTESDGRMFPITDSSQTIIDCLKHALRSVEIHYRQKIDVIEKSSHFQVGPFSAKRLILATGSSPEGFRLAEHFGHTIQKPVPSLFAVNIPNSPLHELSGVTLDDVEARTSSYTQRGPLLLTHFGFSGPAILKLSSWAARHFFEHNYDLDLDINWLPRLDQSQIFDHLVLQKKTHPQKIVSSESQFYLPKNLWRLLSLNKKWADSSLSDLQRLAEKLHADRYRVMGKTTHKEEFVTCGGVTLKEVDFRTMQSKICPGLYFAGEILDIDAVTGGFNFQNAWTTGYLAGTNL